MVPLSFGNLLILLWLTPYDFTPVNLPNKMFTNTAKVNKRTWLEGSET